MNRFNMFLTLLVSIVTVVNSLSCLPCKSRTCPELTCPGSKVKGPCGCCDECAKQIDENCGGPFELSGVCDKGLTCVVNAKSGSDIQLLGEVGICKKNLNDCENAICAISNSPNCPVDSVLVEGYTPPGQCCPLPGRCECRPQKCKQLLCQPGEDKVLIRRATGVPGLCCDVYDCREKGGVCSVVRCAPVTEVTCPDDSSITAGQRSRDGCCELQSKCECEMSRCQPKDCPHGTFPRKTSEGNSIPGTCCNTYTCVEVSALKHCDVRGNLIGHGEKFTQGKCTKCDCLDGETTCSPVTCPKLPCIRQYTPSDACCPKCRISVLERPTTVAPTMVCYSNWKFYANGDQWKIDDCTTCTCHGGQERCIAQACHASCANPRKVDGICCPVCDEPTVINVNTDKCPSMDGCKLMCQDWAVDHQLCPKCECRNDICPMFKCVACDHGYVIDENGCQTCECMKSNCNKLSHCHKRCKHGFQKDRFGCEVCKCNKCPSKAVCDIKCIYGHKVDEHGCELCTCRGNSMARTSDGKCWDNENNSYRNYNEYWKSPDGHNCACVHSHVYCDVVKCPELTCSSPVVNPSSVCPVCSGKQLSAPAQVTCDSMNLDEGDWLVTKDKKKCVCFGGEVMCAPYTTDSCPKPVCDEPTYRDVNGCRVCKDLIETSSSSPKCYDREGISHSHTAQWLLNKCTKCQCYDGSITCNTQTCPSLVGCKKSAYVSWQCCPQCLGAYKCVHDDAVIAFGDEYFDGCRWSTCGTNEDNDLPCQTPLSRRWVPYAIGGGIVALCFLIMILLFVIMCKRGRCSIQRNIKAKYSPGMPQTDIKK